MGLDFGRVGAAVVDAEAHGSIELRNKRDRRDPFLF